MNHGLWMLRLASGSFGEVLGRFLKIQNQKHIDNSASTNAAAPAATTTIRVIVNQALKEDSTDPAEDLVGVPGGGGGA